MPCCCDLPSPSPTCLRRLRVGQRRLLPPRVQLEKVRLDAETSRKRYEAEAAQARAAVAQTESMYKSERAQWVTSLDAQKFEVRPAEEQRR